MRQTKINAHSAATPNSSGVRGIRIGVTDDKGETQQDDSFGGHRRLRAGRDVSGTGRSHGGQGLSLCLAPRRGWFIGALGSQHRRVGREVPRHGVRSAGLWRFTRCTEGDDARDVYRLGISGDHDYGAEWLSSGRFQLRRLSLLGSGGFGVPVGRVIPVAKVPGPEAGPPARRGAAAANLGQWMLSSAPPADDPVVDMQLANIDRTRFDSRRISLKATLFDDLAHITAPVQLIWGGGQACLSVGPVARRQLPRGSSRYQD
jgi:hypothetical protein